MPCDSSNVLENKLSGLSFTRTTFTSQHQSLILAPVFEAMPSPVRQGINVRWEFPQTMTSITVDHLWGVKAELLVGVDGDEDGRNPRVNLVTFKPMVKVLYDPFLGAGIMKGKIRAAQFLVRGRGS